MNKINVQFENLSAKITEAKAKLATREKAEQKEVNEVISEVKGEIEATKVQVSDWTEEKKEDGFADLLKAKMTIEAKNDELKAKFEEKKFESKKHKKEAKVAYAYDNAAYAIKIAEMAVEEALLASLEFIAEEAEYIEEYETNK